MNQKMFWIVFGVVQSLGAAAVLLSENLPKTLFDGAFSFAVMLVPRTLRVHLDLGFPTIFRQKMSRSSH